MFTEQGGGGESARKRTDVRNEDKEENGYKEEIG